MILEAINKLIAIFGIMLLSFFALIAAGLAIEIFLDIKNSRQPTKKE